MIGSCLTGKAYYFRDKEGKPFVAFRLQDYGGNAKGIRLFWNLDVGRKEIDIKETK